MAAWLMGVSVARNEHLVQTSVQTSGYAPAVLVYGVVSDELEEAVELFATRREAELVVQNWDRDEPERAGELRVEPIELETHAN
jgi:hypothetical protein